jgi:hypothetical protein
LIPDTWISFAKNVQKSLFLAPQTQRVCVSQAGEAATRGFAKRSKAKTEVGRIAARSIRKKMLLNCAGSSVTPSAIKALVFT